MSRVVQKPVVEVRATIELTEAEMVLLEGLSRYSDQAVHEALKSVPTGLSMAAVQSLMAVARADIRPILVAADRARKAFKGDAS